MDGSHPRHELIYSQKNDEQKAAAEASARAAKTGK